MEEKIITAIIAAVQNIDSKSKPRVPSQRILPVKNITMIISNWIVHRAKNIRMKKYSNFRIKKTSINTLEDQLIEFCQKW